MNTLYKIRDLFLGQIPNVLHAEVYATAAMAGSASMIAACRLRISPALSALLGGSVCFCVAGRQCLAALEPAACGPLRLDRSASLGRKESMY